MDTRTKGCLLLVMLAAACGGADAKSDTLTKSEAKALVESGDADETVCADNGFNDDGVCDDWCPDGDSADCDDGGTCTDGDTKPADDGCNTCTCSDGGWACTEQACPPQNSQNNSAMCEDGETKHADDGCNTCECMDGAWSCTEIACPPDGAMPITIGECDTETDGFALESAKLSGDTLVAEVAYSGGCEEHVFVACWEGSFLESNPVQARLVIEHDANDDPCEAYPQETLKFDLTAMRENYQEGYQTDEGTILLAVEDETLEYSF